MPPGRTQTQTDVGLVFWETFIFLNERENGRCKCKNGMLSPGEEVSEGCLKVEHGGSHCWPDSVVRAGSRVQQWEDHDSSMGSGTEVSWSWENTAVIAVCKIMNRKCQYQYVDRSYSPSCGHSTLLSSPVSSEMVRSHNDYLSPAVLHSPILPCSHVLSGGPQQ